MATLRETTRQWDAPNLKKNTFDLTHNHPLTANLGRLFPVFTETMPANTSLHVNPSWSFKIKPFLQDMQTNIKCHFQLWRVPLRIIWDNFENFSRQDPTQNSAIAHPYISRDERWVNVGELSDYFGIPSQTFATRESGVFNRYDGFGGSDHKSYNQYGSLVHSSVPLVNALTGFDGSFHPYKNSYTFEYQDNKTPYPCPVNGVLLRSAKISATNTPMLANDIYSNGVTFQAFIHARNRCEFLSPNGGLSGLADTRYSNYVAIEQPITIPLHSNPGGEFIIDSWSSMLDSVSNPTTFVNKFAMLFKGATPESATYFASIYDVSSPAAFTQQFRKTDFPVQVQTTSELIQMNVPYVTSSLQDAPTPRGIYLNHYKCKFDEAQLKRINTAISNEPLWVVLVSSVESPDLPRFFDPYGFTYKNLQKQLEELGDEPKDGKPEAITEYWDRYNSIARQMDEYNATLAPTFVPCGFQTLHNLSGLVNSTDKFNTCCGYGSISVCQDSPTTIVGSEPVTPFEGRTPKQPISALPFRAFEAIYNFRYRVKELDPFTKDGVVCVDDWNTNHGDGADSTTPVHIDNYRVSYPEDYFFGAMPKPSGYDFHQVLVGVTQVGGEHMESAVLHFAKSDDKEDGFDVNVSVKDDGTIGRIDSYSEDADHFTINVLKDGIQYGLPVQAFAFSEAMNKWYEATYKGGRYSWGDFIKAHFGHPATHIGLRHPEFIGGCTYNLDMTPVQNTNSSGEFPLGYQASVGSFQKNDGQGWTVYTDEESIVIGVMYFTLEPINSQSIPKFWLRSQPSDYPTPELANLGTMEITKREIAPLQCDWSDTSNEPYETFGYVQNYNDLCHKWDYASGLYRTQFAHNLYQRVYGVAPVISAELLKIRPEELTCPYQDGNEIEDPIYGVVHLDVRRQIWLNQSPNQITM